MGFCRSWNFVIISCVVQSTALAAGNDCSGTGLACGGSTHLVSVVFVTDDVVGDNFFLNKWMACVY